MGIRISSIKIILKILLRDDEFEYDKKVFINDKNSRVLRF